MSIEKNQAFDWLLASAILNWGAFCLHIGDRKIASTIIGIIGLAVFIRAIYLLCKFARDKRGDPQ